MTQKQLTVLLLSCRRLELLERTVAAARPRIDAHWTCFDNGSSEADQERLRALDFDLLMLSKKNLGQGPALNVLFSSVKTSYFLLLEDDWLLESNTTVDFLQESIAILEVNPRIGQVKLDNHHDKDFTKRELYDGPFYARGRSVRFYVQNPATQFGGFCCPPAVTRTKAVRDVGPLIEAHPYRRWWAESEYSQRFAQQYYACKSPDLLVFKHIGDESSSGWKDAEAERAHA